MIANADMPRAMRSGASAALAGGGSGVALRQNAVRDRRNDAQAGRLRHIDDRQRVVTGWLHDYLPAIELGLLIDPRPGNDRRQTMSQGLEASSRPRSRSQGAKSACVPPVFPCHYRHLQ